jgi:hypothetical protein
MKMKEEKLEVRIEKKSGTFRGTKVKDGYWIYGPDDMNACSLNNFDEHLVMDCLEVYHQSPSKSGAFLLRRAPDGPFGDRGIFDATKTAEEAEEVLSQLAKNSAKSIANARKIPYKCFVV